MKAMKDSMEALLEAGFTRRGAIDYLGTLEREDASDLFSPGYREWAHSIGFYAESACALGLTEANADTYLSDYDYCRVWPLNSWQRVWINDKLTLKYMLSGTRYDRYLARYFYYTGQQGLVPLIDSGEFGGDGFLRCLEAEGEFACKPCNGECSQGFHKLSFADGIYSIDNEPSSKEGVMRFVDGHANYVFTEFFHPGMGMEDISPVIHTLRLLTVNEGGDAPVLAAAYLRFATGVGSDDSKANYRIPEESGVCSYNVCCNLETGRFGDGKLVYGNRTIDAPDHPDTGAPGRGTIECWPELRDMVMGVAKRLGPVEYMGFDVCVTKSGPRLIEINSHSGSKYLQLYRPFMNDPFLSDYFSRKLRAIDDLDDEARARRNGVLR
ncbi:MAG: hypothetical protein LKI25_05920 [Atopobiaceae bacterium]|nr:hypothetical protein [Atopobiaceae bacterium]MCI2173733.1 hypothetical protein [Atopobiaceae bacterium]MCI2207625.1 hypothetical protein [Atopobiaceae bacterium]